MTSRRPYWCPKTKKRRPCWCPKLVLWELNSFLMQTLSFVPINLHRYWPREWKHSIDIRSGFTSFKIKNLVNVENVVPEGLRTLVVYKFSCTSCNACFVGETSQHFSTRIRKHLFSYRSSNVFRHLQSFKLSLRNPTKPDLNQQVKHINMTIVNAKWRTL